MNGAELGAALRGGKNVFGTLVVSPSPRWPQVVRGLGLDFVFIDTEHIALDRAQVSWMCQTYAALGIAPVVRIPSPDPYTATVALDGGAAGVIAPYVETVAQAQALRGAVKCRPLKGSKLEGWLEGGSVEPELASYVEENCANNVLILNIESVPAIAALNDILRVPGIDAVLIGPHDLSCSLGIPEQYDHPRFLEAARTIFRKARAAGVGAGIHFWGDLEAEAALIRDGANLMIHSADLTLFQKHFRLELAEVKRLAGVDSSSATKAETENI